MTEQFVLVPGYVARVQKYGPEWLRIVGGQSWSDQQGVPDSTGITFRCRGGAGASDEERKNLYSNWFHFPIPTPTIVDGVRLKCNLVAVTFYAEEANAFVDEIIVSDRGNELFHRDHLNVTGNHSGDWTEGKTMFTFEDKVVNGSIGISVRVYFDQDANIWFTGAGARFHS